MISLCALLRLHTKYDKPLAGVIGLSGIVACHPEEGGEYENDLPSLSDEQARLVANTPKFIYLGDNDNMVPVEVAKLSFEVLKQAGKSSKDVLQKEPGLGHTTSRKELKKLAEFIQSITLQPIEDL